MCDELTQYHDVSPCSKLEGLEGYRQTTPNCWLMQQALDGLEDHECRITRMEQEFENLKTIIKGQTER